MFIITSIVVLLILAYFTYQAWATVFEHRRDVRNHTRNHLYNPGVEDMH